MMSGVELAIHRSNTERFINLDLSQITLTPQSEVWTNGSKKFSVGVNRAAQNFKVIWAGDTGIVSTSEGQTRRFDFILVGKFDAIVAINDFWLVGKQKNVIEYVYPFNGYEVKCGGVSHGSKPGA